MCSIRKMRVIVRVDTGIKEIATIDSYREIDIRNRFIIRYDVNKNDE